MKKLFGLMMLMTVLILAACGQKETNAKEDSEKEEVAESTPVTTEKVSTETVAVDERLKEPEEGTLCGYFCQMKVYNATEELGAFTAQGIKHDGSNVFFDDVGCMLNQERVDEKEMEKFVRDYNTKDWISLEEANIVKADIKTPMNYGYAFFKEKSDADQFIEEHAGSELTEVAAIDHVAHERHMMRMEKMKNGEGEGHTQGEEKEEEHNTESDHAK